MDSQDSAFRYALDAGAFYTGFIFLSSVYRYCTTQAVFDEVKHIKGSHGAIETLLESNTLQVLNSDRKSIDKVVAAARRTGDYQELSQADISIIALALQLGIVLVTDDFAVANVATTLKIPVKSVASKGITHTRRWIAYCSACGRAFGPNAKECRLCGNRLRRKYKNISE
ncbi:MAG: nucleotide-binding protein [Thermoproteota archaeon]|nr:nucleotide-binding protein [Thermoproteota archaeon]